MTVSRSEVAKENQWDVAALYADIDSWDKEYAKARSLWKAFSALQGHLGEGVDRVHQALELSLSMARTAEKLYTYAHLRSDEDVANDKYKGMYQQALALLHELNAVSSWLEPEIIGLPKETLDTYLKSAELKEYSFLLEKLVRLKEHTLSAKEEELVALAGRALGASHLAFGQLNNADFRFGKVKDGEGSDHELTHGLYSLYLRSPDRTLRQNTFERMSAQFKSYENTICELLGGQVQGHIFQAKSHNFPTCLDAALFPKAVDTSVYHSLIQAVRKNLPSLHRYMKLRKRALGVDELHLYDVYVPFVDAPQNEIAYDQAVSLCSEAVAPLGKTYQSILAAGLGKDRWVDRYENVGKRSGAYSSGCFDSMPYILMNYKGILRDVYTLAHEAGHSMHSYLSRENQPYHYADYVIFVAEVASTFNEELLFRLLLDQTSSEQEKAYLINERIEDIRATLFRQTMFAEFELAIHEMAEGDEPLTPASLNEKYYQLNVDYFGPDVVVDKDIAIEWARIPHFYYNFYVYQYTTGVSAALSLAERVLSGGAAERDAYLNFLKGGGSKHPLDLLKGAGVDLTTPEPVDAALHRFDQLVKELEVKLSTLV